jgi:hypothetical protein
MSNARLEGDAYDRDRVIRAAEKRALKAFLDYPNNIANCGSAVEALAAIVLRMAGEDDDS